MLAASVDASIVAQNHPLSGSVPYSHSLYSLGPVPGRPAASREPAIGWNDQPTLAGTGSAHLTVTATVREQSRPDNYIVRSCACGARFESVRKNLGVSMLVDQLKRSVNFNFGLA